MLDVASINEVVPEVVRIKLIEAYAEITVDDNPKDFDLIVRSFAGLEIDKKELANVTSVFVLAY